MFRAKTAQLGPIPILLALRFYLLGFFKLKKGLESVYNCIYKYNG